jgi:hypothetical protein
MESPKESHTVAFSANKQRQSRHPKRSPAKIRALIWGILATGAQNSQMKTMFLPVAMSCRAT